MCKRHTVDTGFWGTENRVQCIIGKETNVKWVRRVEPANICKSFDIKRRPGGVTVNFYLNMRHEYNNPHRNCSSVSAASIGFLLCIHLDIPYCDEDLLLYSDDHQRQKEIASDERRNRKQAKK